MLFKKLISIVIKVLLPALLILILTLVNFSNINQAIDIKIPKINQSNPIVVENIKPGTTDWQLTNPATRREIES
jgi:hypothetical protein